MSVLIYGVHHVSAFLLLNGDWSTDYVQEMVDSKQYFAIYYEHDNQIYCSLVNKEKLRFKNNDLATKVYPFWEEDKAGWFKIPLSIDIFTWQNLFNQKYILTKRISAKQIIRIHGYSEYCNHSGSSNVAD